VPSERVLEVSGRGKEAVDGSSRKKNGIQVTAGNAH